jgi:hypothetical protein
MADRSSALVFGECFRLLAEHCEVPQVRGIANELFELTRDFDFTWDQMECDASLVALGLLPK